MQNINLVYVVGWGSRKQNTNLVYVVGGVGYIILT